MRFLTWSIHANLRMRKRVKYTTCESQGTIFRHAKTCENQHYLKRRVRQSSRHAKFRVEKKVDPAACEFQYPKSRYANFRTLPHSNFSIPRPCRMRISGSQTQKCEFQDPAACEFQYPKSRYANLQDYSSKHANFSLIYWIWDTEIRMKRA